MHDEQSIYILCKDRICHVEPSWRLKEKKKSIILILDFCASPATPEPRPQGHTNGRYPVSLSLASVRRGMRRPVFHPQLARP